MDKQRTQIMRSQPIKVARPRPGRKIPGLVVLNGTDLGKVFYFDEDGKAIGRDPEAQIHLHDDSVSRRQAQVYRQRAEDSGAVQYVVVDLHSTNGTLVNEERISKAFLHDGDKIRVGDTTLKFTLHDEAEYNYYQAIQRRIEIDDLTGMLTISFFYEQLEQQLKRAQRYRSGLSVLMMDVDHLKAVNEAHGHLAGSLVIKTVGHLLREHVAKLGQVGRYGGDEFIAFVRDLEPEKVLEKLEPVRQVIEDHAFTFKDQRARITLSTGVASYPWDGRNREELVTAADAALFKAKQKGKNRVETYVGE